MPAGGSPLLVGVLGLDRVRLGPITVGLLVLHEGEPNVQGADVEDDGDGDVKEAQQHHQLTGPVEKVEVDGGVRRHLRGSASASGSASGSGSGSASVCWGGKQRVAPGSNRPLAAALRLHFEEVGRESFGLLSLVSEAREPPQKEPGSTAR